MAFTNHWQNVSRYLVDSRATIGRNCPSDPRAAGALDRLSVEPAWVLNKESGAHGPAHGARVLVWANAIANSMVRAGDQVDVGVVRWAAVLHDARRETDGVDDQHGARAASWIRDCANGPLSHLDRREREAVAYCCEWHVPPDREAPAMTPELRCLKDADSLDRVRLGSLDLRYLRTPYALALVRHARALFAETASIEPLTGWMAVRTAAMQLGVWDDDVCVEDVTARVRGQDCYAC